MIRVLIVDDEAPARRKIVDLVEAASDVEVVGEAEDGTQAVDRILELRPDLVFLDIQMPNIDGFGVIEAIGVDRMPIIVFITAFDEHAVRAFEVHAMDYLLKPFAPSRFENVLERARRRIASSSARRRDERLDLVLAELGRARAPVRRLMASAGHDRQVLVDLSTVTVIRSDRNYLCLVTPRGEFRRRGTLSELESRLDGEEFLRINRSQIVRLEAVREVQPWFHGDARIVLDDGTVLTWSRRYRSGSIDRF